MLRVFLGATAGAVLALTAVASEIDSRPSTRPCLVLCVRCRDAEGNERQQFAINEPVWLSAELRTTGAIPVSVGVNWERYRGISCRPAEGYEGMATVVPRSMASDNIVIVRNVLGPDSKVGADLLLGDFLEAREAETLPVECAMDLWDEADRPLTVKTVVGVRFAPKLGDGESAQLLDRLRTRYDSGDERTRVRMVGGLVSISSPAAIDFLAKAITDKSEEVQLTALGVLSRMKTQKEQAAALIRKASENGPEPVRLRAKWIESRTPIPQ